MLRTNTRIRCLQHVIVPKTHHLKSPTLTFVRYRTGSVTSKENAALRIATSQPRSKSSRPSQPQKPAAALVIDPENKLTPLEKRIVNSSKNRKLLIGDFVEVFRNGQYNGIVVGQNVISGKQQRLTVVLRNGKTKNFRTSDVAFVIPDFVSTPEVTRFLRTPVTLDRQATTMDFIPTEYIRALQTYQQTVKLEKGMANRQLESMHSHFNVSPTGATSATLDDLARYAFNCKQPTMMNRHATFLYLVANNIHYYPDSDILQSDTWHLRSELEMEPISKVIQWIRARETPFTGFLERANQLVDFYRTHADEQLGTISPDAIAKIKQQVQLTDTDKMFVNFMVDWIKMPKVIMESPHDVFGPSILKGLQCYDSLFVDQSLAITFLKQIGMFRPWDNVGLLEETGLIRPFLWSKDAEKYDKTMEEYTTMFLDQDHQQKWKTAGFYAKDPSDAIRHDFGDMPVYTIDDPDAKEIDDGISVEHIPGTNNTKAKTWLHIHIADPTAYVPPNHSLASIMADRIQTLYLPERHYPMLPLTLSSHTFSLGSTAQVTKNGSQYAFTFSALLDDQGQLSEYKVRPSFVRNVVKLHYDDVDKFFESKLSAVTGATNSTLSFSHPQKQLQQDTPDPTTSQLNINNLSTSIQDDLLDIYSITQKHSQQRLRNGAINFERPEPVISLSPTPLELPRLAFDGLQYASELPTIDLTLSRYNVSPSRKMVAEMMMLGGRAVSQYAREHGVIIPFRTQKWLPSQAAVQQELLELRDPVTGEVPFKHLIRYMKDLPPAGLSMTSGLPHALMGITGGYCKATSPLRRYMDMIIHWQLKSHLLKEKPSFDLQLLEQLGPRIEIQEKQLSMLQQRSLQYWVLSLVQRLDHDNANRTWKCMVSDKSGLAKTPLGGSMMAAPATILELGIRGRVEHLKDTVHPGDVLDVRVSNINPRLGFVGLEAL